MRFFGSLFFFAFMLCAYGLGVSAETAEITPEVSKYEVLFNEEKEFNDRQLLIKFKASTSMKDKQKILQTLKLKELSNLNRGNFTLASVSYGHELASIAEELARYKQIEFVEPNYQLKATYTPKDPKYSKQWYLKKIQMPKAWDVSKGHSSIVVAVIDGGVQTTHPELKGKIVSPYDVPSGRSTISPDDHGTHVAGIIAATMNKTGIAGIAPSVKLMPVDVFNNDSADAYNVAEGIIYAADHNADIMNLSLGSRNYSQVLEYAVNYAASKGVLIIAAAGNEDTYDYTYPAALPNVLGVSATDQKDVITDFSNYGGYIDFSAPGAGIYSTVSGSSYRSMDGTSMASPVVSGVAALVLSKNPFLDPSQVVSIMKSSAVDLGAKGWDYLYGYGRVDAYKALSKTPSPLHSISIAASTFTIKGTNTNKISFYAQSGTKVSLFIQNSKGKTVRKLLSSKKWSGGKVTASWDGKQDNGTFVSSGTYTVVFKVTNGEKTIYKKLSVKALDRTKPSIKVTTSVSFSPSANKKLTIPYQLNKDAKITAVVYDRRNKEVKRILSNKFVTAGKKSIVWDGKTSKGKKVSDGTYTMVMTAIDSRKVKGVTRKIAIKVDSVKPTGKSTLTSSIFKVDGKLKTGAKLTFKESVYVSAYVKTSKGTTVKKLSADKMFKKGTTYLKWDGKNDKKQFVAEGKYYFYIKFKDPAGNYTTIKSSMFTVQDWIKPVVQSSAGELALKSKTTLPISFTTSKTGVIMVEILKGGEVLRTIEPGTSKNKGSHSFIFDGKDEIGEYLADGIYQYRITLTDKYKLTGSYTGNITVALTKVEIEYPELAQFFMWEDVASEVFYKLSDDATVTIEILNMQNQKVRTILSNTAKGQGIHSFQWDGLDEDGFYEYDDKYMYTIKAMNKAGNETIVSGLLSGDGNPSWLQSQEYNFIQDQQNPWINTMLELDISVTSPSSLIVYIYDSYYSDAVLDQVEYNLTQGINEIEYEKLSESDQYYLLVFKDSLGNEYSYGIEEYLQ